MLAHVPAVLGKRVTEFADGAVAVVGRDFHQNSRAAGTVAFEHDLFDLSAFQFTGAAHDSALDVVGRHTDRLGGGDGGTKARVAIGIAAAAGGNHDLLDDARKDLAALGPSSPRALERTLDQGISLYCSNGNSFGCGATLFWASVNNGRSSSPPKKGRSALGCSDGANNGASFNSAIMASFFWSFQLTGKTQICRQERLPHIHPALLAP